MSSDRLPPEVWWISAPLKNFWQKPALAMTYVFTYIYIYIIYILYIYIPIFFSQGYRAGWAIVGMLQTSFFMQIQTHRWWFQWCFFSDAGNWGNDPQFDLYFSIGSPKITKEQKIFNLNVASIHPSLHPSIHIAPHQSLVVQNPRSGPPPATVEAMVCHFLGKSGVVWVLTKLCSRWKHEMCIFNSPTVRRFQVTFGAKKLVDPPKGILGRIYQVMISTWFHTFLRHPQNASKLCFFHKDWDQTQTSKVGLNAKTWSKHIYIILWRILYIYIYV